MSESFQARARLWDFSTFIEPDPRVPLILGRCFLKTGRALIDVHKGELTLRIGSEAITYNLDQTSRYSANYTHMTANKIDVIDMACEEYSQEVLEAILIVNHHFPSKSRNKSNLFQKSETELKVCENYYSQFLPMMKPTCRLNSRNCLPILEYGIFGGRQQVARHYCERDGCWRKKSALVTVLKFPQASSAWKLLTFRVSTQNFVPTDSYWKEGLCTSGQTSKKSKIKNPRMLLKRKLKNFSKLD
ncbi:hypothetical protein Tco_1109258 [Tanacetum coccineum]